MKHFLRIFIGLSIILLALSVTALSCNKGDKSNSGNNSGGNGDNTPKPSEPDIIITNFPTLIGGANVGNLYIAKPGPKTNDGGKEYDTVLINVDAVNGATRGTVKPNPIGSAAIFGNGTFADMLNIDNDDNVEKLFDLEITGGVVGTTPAKEGLVLVSIGSLDSFDEFSTPTRATVPMNYLTGPYVADPRATGSVNAPIYKPAGMGFFAHFIDKTTPTSEKADEAPFAFSHYGALADEQVLVTCRSVVSTITTATPDPDTTKLTGGQKATCYIALRSVSFLGRNEWNTAITTADADATIFYKTKFYITVAAIRTDDKSLSKIVSGFPGNTPADKVAAFMNGLSTDEMKALKNANVFAYKKILLNLVQPANFTAGTLYR